MVQWNSEKDQILLKGVFQYCQIKIGKDLLEHLAKMIGEGATPKAISHRLNNIKNMGKPTKTASDGPATPDKKATTKIAATPRSRTKSAKAANKNTGSGSGEDSQGSPNPVAKPTPPSRKRGRPKKITPAIVEEQVAESDAEQQDFDDELPQAKRIKAEPGSDDTLDNDFGDSSNDFV